MRTALGMVVKDFDDKSSIFEFLENAKKYNHRINNVVIAYTRSCNMESLEKISKKIKVELIYINNSNEMYDELINKGISSKSIARTLKFYGGKDGLIPYGVQRNNILVKAMLSEIDVLFLIDENTRPVILEGKYDKYKFKYIDYFGSHLEYLQHNDIMVTTSEYSGYNFMPPFEFHKMKELMVGIGSRDKLSIIDDFEERMNFTPGRYNDRKVSDTKKLFSGNMAIKLKYIKEIYPFYSPSYMFDNKLFLGCGEDDIFSYQLRKIKDKRIVDIDLKIFKDTFSNFPKTPDVLNDDSTKDILFNTCVGLIGRNPFLNWMNRINIDEIYEEQNKHLKVSSKKLAKKLKDDRFLELPQILERSYEELDRYIYDYQMMTLGWRDIVKNIDKVVEKNDDYVEVKY